MHDSLISSKDVGTPQAKFVMNHYWPVIATLVMIFFGISGYLANALGEIQNSMAVLNSNIAVLAERGRQWDIQQDKVDVQIKKLTEITQNQQYMLNSIANK